MPGSFNASFGLGFAEKAKVLIPNPNSELIREPNLLVPGRKPVGAVKVDWSNPATEEMRLCYLFNQGSNTVRNVGLFQGGNLTATNNADIRPGVGGNGGFVDTGDTDAWRHSGTTLLEAGITHSSNQPQHFSILSVFSWNTAPTDDRACFWNGLSGGGSEVGLGYAHNVAKFGIISGSWNCPIVARNRARPARYTCGAIPRALHPISRRSLSVGAALPVGS